MFGLGFWEIFVILIVAIIALGPEKLPSAMVDVAKLFKKIKSGFEDAKSTLDHELKLTEMKAEADKYKSQYEELKSSMNVDALVDAPSYSSTPKGDIEVSASDDGVVREKVSFKKAEQPVANSAVVETKNV